METIPPHLPHITTPINKHKPALPRFQILLVPPFIHISSKIPITPVSVFKPQGKAALVDVAVGVVVDPLALHLAAQELALVQTTVGEFVYPRAAKGACVVLTLEHLGEYCAGLEGVVLPYTLHQQLLMTMIIPHSLSFLTIQSASQPLFQCTPHPHPHPHPRPQPPLPLLHIPLPLPIIPHPPLLISLHPLSLPLIPAPLSFVHPPIFIKVLPLTFLQSIGQLALVSLTILADVYPVPVVSVVGPVAQVDVAFNGLEHADTLEGAVVTHLPIVPRTILKLHRLQIRQLLKRLHKSRDLKAVLCLQILLNRLNVISRGLPIRGLMLGRLLLLWLDMDSTKWGGHLVNDRTALLCIWVCDDWSCCCFK